LTKEKLSAKTLRRGAEFSDISIARTGISDHVKEAPKGVLLDMKPGEKIPRASQTAKKRRERPLIPDCGTLPLPTNPGLGVEVQPYKLARYSKSG
jgi:hypothetical protein